jgi:uncharacterized protein YecE (DUF72 family)
MEEIFGDGPQSAPATGVHGLSRIIAAMPDAPLERDRGKGRSPRAGIGGEPAIRVGTSGWVYNWWRGLFYPERLPQPQWLAHYVAHFPTVEINASFYRLQKPEIFRAWRDAAPAGFVYAVKGSRFITHLKRLKAEPESIKIFFDGVRELGPALGPILYQLPPNLGRDMERLEHFVDGLPSGFDHVFEFRNTEWFEPEVRDFLEKRNLAFCIHDHRAMEVPRWVTGPLTYWRFHGGRGKLGGYTDVPLMAAAREMRRQIRAGRPVYAYFNNDAHGCAIRDSRRLIALTQSHREMPEAAYSVE